MWFNRSVLAQKIDTYSFSLVPYISHDNITFKYKYMAGPKGLGRESNVAGAILSFK